jgi:hypothetical protein
VQLQPRYVPLKADTNGACGPYNSIPEALLPGCGSLSYSHQTLRNANEFEKYGFTSVVK